MFKLVDNAINRFTTTSNTSIPYFSSSDFRVIQTKKTSYTSNWCHHISIQGVYEFIFRALLFSYLFKTHTEQKSVTESKQYPQSSVYFESLSICNNEKSLFKTRRRKSKTNRQKNQVVLKRKQSQSPLVFSIFFQRAFFAPEKKTSER